MTYLIDRDFDDFDEFCCNARAWDLDYRQIEPGPFCSQLLIAGKDQMQFTWSRLARRLIQKGAPPKKLRTFGLLANSQISMFWRGQQVSGDQLFVFPDGAELNCISQSDFSVFAVSLSDPILAQVCQSLNLPELERILGGKEVFCCDPDNLELLRQFLAGAERNLRTGGARRFDFGMLDVIEIETAERILSLLSNGKHPQKVCRIRRREKILEIATDYINANSTQHLSISELCHVANTSERTLEYAFRERYGVTPKYFITACRLNTAKKALLFGSSSETSVSDVALQAGFWHRSKFAEDYKKLFRELPSQTLRRSVS